VTAGTKGTKPNARYDTPGAKARKPVAAAPQSTPGPGGGGAHSPGQPANPAGYDNPFRHVTNLVGERIDMGVDYSGEGPVYAVGPGKVVAASSNSGWPGGGWISYELTEGPLKGQQVYVAEDVTPQVSAGQHVDANTIIGNMRSGGSGIETGFAAPGEQYTTLAMAQGQSNTSGDPGAYSTGWGIVWNDILVRLGAPTGTINQGPAHSNPQGYTLDKFPGWVKDIPIIGPIISGGAGAASGLSEAGHWIGVFVTTITDPHLWISLGWLFMGISLLILGLYLLVRLSSQYKAAEGAALDIGAKAL
jgi:hypothetical protein